jgi:hypothetical protein
VTNIAISPAADRGSHTSGRIKRSSQVVEGPLVLSSTPPSSKIWFQRLQRAGGIHGVYKFSIHKSEVVMAIHRLASLIGMKATLTSVGDGE